MVPGSTPPHRSDDAALVARIRTGDRQAFESLFHRYYDVLIAFAAAYVRFVEVAEEVVGDVFLWVWTNRAEWTPREGARAYLYGAVRNRALNAARAARNAAVAQRRLALGADSALAGSVPPLPDALFEDEHRQQIVWRVVDALPSARRMVLVFRWQHGMSWEEIAESLGMTVDAVKKQHSRALAVLREKLPRVLH